MLCCDLLYASQVGRAVLFTALVVRETRIGSSSTLLLVRVAWSRPLQVRGSSSYQDFVEGAVPIAEAVAVGETRMRGPLKLTPWSGCGLGAALGLFLTVLMWLVTVVKLALGGDSAGVQEWTGTVSLLISFPLSQFLDSLSGWVAPAAVTLAPVLNWAAIGLLIGFAASLLTRREKPER